MYSILYYNHTISSLSHQLAKFGRTLIRIINHMPTNEMTIRRNADSLPSRWSQEEIKNTIFYSYLVGLIVICIWKSFLITETFVYNCFNCLKKYAIYYRLSNVNKFIALYVYYFITDLHMNIYAF